MNILVLSTISAHHTYFINKIDKLFKISQVIYETRSIEKDFETKSPFEDDEIEYEKKYYFNKTKEKIRDTIKVSVIDDVNNIKSIDLIKKDFDVVIVFGCGIISSHIIKMFNSKLINVHRGIARKYRGLDSDLWAIYNNDFINIGTTIHFIDERLDTGDILFEKNITFESSDKIYHLRSKTTDLAIEGVLEYLKNMDLGNLNKKRQINIGKYFSAMPSSLKDECCIKFAEFIKNKFHE